MNLKETIKKLQERSTESRIKGYLGDANELDFRRHVLLLLSDIHNDLLLELKSVKKRLIANNIVIRNQNKLIGRLLEDKQSLEVKE